jgi:hypothetical protein
MQESMRRSAIAFVLPFVTHWIGFWPPALALYTPLILLASSRFAISRLVTGRVRQA